MIRKCYGCGKELTVFEAMKGQAVFNWIEYESMKDQVIEFEGWVHCIGEDCEFTQEDDTELRKLCEKNDLDYYDGVTHACSKCVRELAEKEGIIVPKSVIKGEDFIYRCPECKSTHVSVYCRTLTGFEHEEKGVVKEETTGVDEAYLIQCDDCDHKVDITNDQRNEDFHDYETEIEVEDLGWKCPKCGNTASFEYYFDGASGTATKRIGRPETVDWDGSIYVEVECLACHHEGMWPEFVVE